MAKVDPKGYLDERKAKGFGEDSGPARMSHDGKVTVTCLALNHTRGKAKGTWGVSALLLAVEGPDVGKVHVHDMWTYDQVHAFVAEGFGFRAPYENGLPANGTDPDRFDADPDLLEELNQIVKCQDQSVSKDGVVIWNSTIPAANRRAPYTVATFQKKPGLNDDSKMFLEARWFNQLKRSGEKGPYFVDSFRDEIVKIDIKGVVAWFNAQCERKVRAANEAAAARRKDAGGDDDTGGGGGGSGWNDEVPF